MDVMITDILRYIGAYTVELGGVDAIAFTGGIGENSAYVRRRIAEGLKFMGVKLNKEANAREKVSGLISERDSSVELFVIPADEEYMVVGETYKFCME